jgi:hypothetical protein
MIIGDNSPLRKRPAKIERRQAVFLDAIQYSVNVADLAHARLQSNLAAGVQHEGASTVADAWSMIDSLHRLRELLDQMPGIKKNSPRLQSLLRNTEDVKTLRNGVQHLRREIDELVAKNLPVWGVINWIAPYPDGTGANIGVYVAGTLSDYNNLLFIAPTREEIPPVDRITLTAHGCSVNLSEVMRRYVEPLVRSLEDQLEEAKKRPQPPENETLRLVLEL